MPLSDFKDLGIGVGLRPPHYPVFTKAPPATASWVEVISENYMGWRNQASGRALQILEKVRQNVPVVLHGVSMSLGSCDPIDLDYLAKLKELTHRIQPAWISDHLCWTGVGGRNFHDLLPLPYTEEALDLVTRKIRTVQDYFGRRMLIENPSTYLQFASSEMTEWDFMAELARRSDCGILLDLNNVYVSSVNHGFDPLTYLRAIPKDRVGQIHLAGHTDRITHLVDTHDAPVCEAVWELYRFAVEHFGKVSAMIERDDNIPDWSELEAELRIMRDIRSQAGKLAESRETPSFEESARAP